MARGFERSGRVRQTQGAGHARQPRAHTHTALARAHPTLAAGRGTARSRIGSPAAASGTRGRAPAVCMGGSGAGGGLRRVCGRAGGVVGGCKPQTLAPHLHLQLSAALLGQHAACMRARGSRGARRQGQQQREGGRRPAPKPNTFAPLARAPTPSCLPHRRPSPCPPHPPTPSPPPHRKS